MATSLLPPNDHLPPEEGYIDMDFPCAASSSSSSSSCSSPSQPTEFEFHMTSNHNVDAAAAAAAMPSPADELFYKGKLLPLHLPPRLQMVEQLLGAPLPSLASASASAAATPYDSCHASPAPSCCASGELRPEEYFHDCFLEEPADPLPKKPWARPLKFIKEATLGLKLKATKSYFKSFFPRSKAAKAEAKATIEEAAGCDQRRSISGGNNLQASTAAETSISSSSFASSKSSSFSSVNSSGVSNGGQQQPILRRSSSVSSDGESSIQGAIAYCRKSSQQVVAEFSARKSASNVGFCLISASKIAPDCEHEKLLLH